MDPEFIRDLFEAVGPIRLRRMFGGTGIYAGERMFALEAGGALYLKADEETVPAFEREGSDPFTYESRGGRRAVMSYWALPEHLLDSPDDVAPWARAAIAAAERGARKARRRKGG